MQTQQHEAETELMGIKKNNTIKQHKRKMEVLVAELEVLENNNQLANNLQ